MTDRSPEARLLIEKWTERAEAARDKHALDSGKQDDSWKGLAEAYEICAEELEALLTEEAATRPARETEEAPTCQFHGTMVADDEMGRSWHCAVCDNVAARSEALEEEQ